MRKRIRSDEYKVLRLYARNSVYTDTIPFHITFVGGTTMSRYELNLGNMQPGEFRCVFIAVCAHCREAEMSFIPIKNVPPLTGLLQKVDMVVIDNKAYHTACLRRHD